MIATSTALPRHAQWHARTKSMRLPTGINMAYMEAGNPDGETILLIHGFTDSSRIWRLTMEKLQDCYHLFAIDLRGFGQSDKPAQAVYSMTQHAEDILAFMDAAGIASATLLAHSMGTMVAQTVAFTAPERVERLILASTMTHMHETPKDVRDICDLYFPLDLSSMDTREMQETFLPHPENCFDTEFPAAYFETLRGVRGTGLAAAWYGMSLTDNRNFLQFITAPILILWGTEDEIFTAAYQEEVRHALPDAAFIPLAGVSHEIPTQIPLELAEYTQEFLKSC